MAFARNPVKKIFSDLSAAPPTIAGWLVLVAAMDTPVSAIEVFNGSGSVLKLSKAPTGQESTGELSYYLIPGTSSGVIPVEIPRGATLSIAAVDKDVVDGSLVINCFG